MRRVAEYAAAGHKVIRCATHLLGETNEWTGSEPEEGFAFSGLLAFADPVREGVREAVESCMEAGIGIIMITGTIPERPATIAREVGLGDGATQRHHHGRTR